MAVDYNAFITEALIDGDDDGPLAGTTVAVKDNISTEGVATTCGSDMLADYVPPYSATVVERLTDAGARIVGKTNMDEFGMGTTTETSAFGPTRNPADPERVPGGSSGGSAAAVAAGEADVALGSDTGGSVRCPAAFCGVVGIKPTYGLVSRYGLVAYANSLEQIGPIAPTVAEAAAVLDVIAGPDPNDGTTRDPNATTDGDVSTDYAAAADGDVEGLTIGVPTELFDGADERVVETVEAAIDDLVAAGATTTTISLPSVEHAVEAYYEEGFGAEVKRRILLGTYALSAGYHDEYYAKAQDARAWVRQDFEAAFETVDVIASPTMPVLPFELGESLEDPLRMYLADANTTPVNLANLPAISVPAGEADGLPVGLQLVGPAFEEATVIRAASAVEGE